jgi:energy-coupling factor transporter transmembrane protein EcfT
MVQAPVAFLSKNWYHHAVMKILTAINAWIAKIETIIIVIVLAIMILLAFFQVVMRNIFDQGLLWGDIFLRHLVLWVGFLGASLATREVHSGKMAGHPAHHYPSVLCCHLLVFGRGGLQVCSG